MYNKIFTIGQSLSHIIDKQYLIKDIDMLDDNTLLIVKKKDYMNIPNYLAKRTLIISEQEIIECSLIPFKQTSFYRKNKILHKLEVRYSKHSFDVKFLQFIIENPKYSVSDKFHFTLVKGLIKKFKHIGLQNKNTRRMSTEVYFKALNLITKNSYNRARFNTEMKSFLNSGLVERFNNINFDLAKNNSFEYLHSIYSTKVIKKTSRFNRDIFLTECITFSYSKPLVQKSFTEIQTTISQTTVASYYNLNQSSISSLMKSKKKLYKFEITTKEEYNNNLFARENNSEDVSSYIFPIHTFSHHFDKDTGTTHQETFYIKSLGTKLISSIFFKSMVKPGNKVMKLNKLYEPSDKARSKSGMKFESLKTLDNSTKYKLIESNPLELINTIDKNNRDIKRPTNEFFQSAISSNYSNPNLCFQLISTTYKQMKSKMITFMNTVSYIKSIKDLGFIKEKQFFDFKLSINKQFNIINYIHNQAFSNISKLRLSDDNILKLRNSMITNFKVFHKFISKVISNINIYKANGNSFKLLEYSSSDLYLMEPKVITNELLLNYNRVSNNNVPW